MLQMQKLQDLGYSAFLFGFFEEDVHFVGTSDADVCSHPKIIQYMMALMTASECLILFYTSLSIFIANTFKFS